MASSTTANANALPSFILTPQQQNLLFRALTSNQPTTNSKSPEENTLSPQSLTTSPTQNQNNSGVDLAEGLQESPFVDYDYDFGPDGSFDFDFNADGNAKMIGDLPGSGGSESSKDDSKSSSPENESSDKRGHPDSDDDDDVDEGGGKRREGEKVPKKPGRKPLTNEPSSKRKAQNRAAQRAFRERKERHLKDLETKVEELEKVSESTNSENSQLKSQIEKLTVELNEYKKRVTLLSNAPRSASTGSRNQPFGFGALQNLSDTNFQFEFPKFGSLSSPQNGVNGNAKRAETYPSPPSNLDSNKSSPQERARDKTTSSSRKDREVPDAQRKDALANNDSSSSSNSNNNNHNVSPYENTYSGTASRTSLDSTTFSVNGCNGASPSSSSNSNMGASSSCGTSPEPFTQSPVGFKPVDTLTTIGEEQPSTTSDPVHAGFGSAFGNIDFGNLDWLSHQNGQFDPQLFGDYREPQNNILANATLDDNFFNDAFDVDFATPYNVAPSSSSPKPAKKNICDVIDAQKEQDDTPVTTANSKLLTCNNIWEKLQTCPKVHNGEIDLDGLCSDLQKKAKCGGTGAVVDEHDFKAIMTRYLGSDANCPSSS